MTKSLYKVSPSGEVGGAGAETGAEVGGRVSKRERETEGEREKESEERRGEWRGGRSSQENAEERRGCGGAEVEKKPTIGEREARSDSGGTIGGQRERSKER